MVVPGIISVRWPESRYLPLLGLLTLKEISKEFEVNRHIRSLINA